jgi:hypothetical protein
MRFLQRALAPVVAGAVLACGGAYDSAGPPTGSVTVSSVAVSGTATLEVGHTSQMGASATGTDGYTMTGRTFTWSSSNTAVATVNENGLVTAVGAGTATITASTGGKSGSRTVTVTGTPPSQNTIAITGTLSAQAGATSQLTATVRDASGSVVANAPVSWFTSDSTIIAVSPTGLVTARRIGTALIAVASGTATGSAQFTSSLAPYTFSFAASMTPAEQQAIRDNVQFAHAFQKATFNRAIQNATTITASTNAPGCAQGGAAAFQSQGQLTFCVANPGWLDVPPLLRQKIVQHELFHVWQFENHWIGNPATAGATWLIEGAAEIMGYRGIIDRGLLTLPVAIGCQVKESSDFKTQHPPGLPPLSSVETSQAFNTTVGPLYTVSMLAADQLTQTGDLVALRTYADAIAAGTSWETAFQSSFGTSLSSFYSQFPGYVASIPVPATYQCSQ